ncbi:MAG TPA: tetratricopeptide repeat protein [Burkholderiales bacterium]
MPDTLRAQAQFAAAARHIETRDYARAEADLRAALAIDAAFAAAHGNLGYVLSRLGRLPEAEAAYRHCLELRPDYIEIQLSHGALLTRLKRLEEAESACRRAIALHPGAPAAWSNLGACLAALQREGEAEDCQRHAIALDPVYAPARFNLSYLLLRQARYTEGFAMFEARHWYAPLAALACARWRGESLNGKRVLVAYEPGHGDMIFFLRYAPQLKERGAAAVTLICHPGLQTLFTGLSCLDRVLPINAPLNAADYDCWTPLASLPHYCATSEATIPAALPYLHADPAQAAAWSARLAAQLPAGPRVGLVWRGNPNFENDADRSLPSLSTLAPVLAVAGINFISLQKGAGESDVFAPVLDVAAQLTDFAASAALMMNLDLVISVDTAVAHLAGALAQACWLLLPDYKTDWRWLKGRADSPWYPGVMRLFRQARGGGWDGVLREVAAALAQWKVTRPVSANRSSIGACKSPLEKLSPGRSSSKGSP